jgi:DNA-binding NarL/FixJ family response regulator
MTRLLIADDHEVVRSGLRSIIAAQPRWEVVGEAMDGKDAVRKAVELKPDVAILDYSLPLINGVEATRQICARSPGIEILIFTMHDSETLIFDLLKAGARGYLLKSDAGRFLIAAIESLAAHKPDPRRHDRMHPDAARARGHSAHRRGAQQQADRQHSHHQREDRRNPPRRRHAQAEPHLRRLPRPLRRPQQDHRSLTFSADAWHGLAPTHSVIPGLVPGTHRAASPHAGYARGLAK